MTDAFAQLQALRELRERRAQRRLLASQRALAAAGQVLEAQQRQAQQACARAEQAAARLQRTLTAEGLPAGRYRLACEHMARLRQAIAHGEHSCCEALASQAQCQQVRDADHAQFGRRHRQLQALLPWLEQRARRLLHLQEAIEESLHEEPCQPRARGV